jgi:hypothetical protein
MVFLVSLLLLLSLIPWNVNSEPLPANKTAATESITSEGCQPDHGYFKNDTDPKCYPLDSIGIPPPKDKVFCAALGCPYNPPDLG